MHSFQLSQALNLCELWTNCEAWSVRSEVCAYGNAWFCNGVHGRPEMIEIDLKKPTARLDAGNLQLVQWSQFRSQLTVIWVISASVGKETQVNFSSKPYIGNHGFERSGYRQGLNGFRRYWRVLGRSRYRDDLRHAWILWSTFLDALLWCQPSQFTAANYHALNSIYLLHKCKYYEWN